MAMAIPLVFGMGGAYLGATATVFGIGFTSAMVGASVGFFAGTMIGSMLFPQKQPSLKPGRVGSWATQQVNPNAVLPVIYGKVRLAGNIAYLGDATPVVVEHKSGGGKGSKKKPVATETRYYRSFLIGLCFGPAKVTQIWKGKEDVSLDDVTVFQGDGNSGLSTLLGKEYAQFKHMTCVFFDEYDCGNQENVPMFMFEVVRVKTSVIGFRDYFPSTNFNSALRLLLGETLDTSWGADGYFKPSSGQCTTYGVARLSDGSIIAGFGETSFPWSSEYSCFFEDASGTLSVGDTITGNVSGITAVVERIAYVTSTDGMIWFSSCSGTHFVATERMTAPSTAWVKIIGTPTTKSTVVKLTPAGVPDISWCNKGWLQTSIGNRPSAIAVDSDDNLYVANQDSSRVGLVKYNSSGVVQWAKKMTGAGSGIPNPIFAFAFDSTGSKVYCGGNTMCGGVIPGNPKHVSCLSTLDGSLNFYLGPEIPGESAIAAISLLVDSEDNIFVHSYAMDVSGTQYALVKYSSDGAIDTSWGTNGFSAANRVAAYVLPLTHNNSMDIDAGENIFIISSGVDGGGGPTTDFYLDKVSSSGVMSNLVSFPASAGVYCLRVIGAQVYLGTEYDAIIEGSKANLHVYSTDGEYLFGEAAPDGNHNVFYSSLLADSDSLVDWNPADIIWDMFSNPIYGSGLSSFIDIETLQEIRVECARQNYYMSIIMDTQKPFSDWFDVVLSHFMGYAFMGTTS